MACAWCGKLSGTSEAANSHGICNACFETLLGVPNLSEDEIGALPFGVILLNRNGVVLTYNAVEQQLSQKKPEAVLGRNFFTEIAPCTQVKNFQGRFGELLNGSHNLEHFEFVFKFPHGKVAVDISFVKRDSEHIFVLIKKKDVESSLRGLY